MLKYTGHPFVDVGVAVLENYLKKPCEDFALDDLNAAAKWLRQLYERKDLKGYLTVHFPNSGWCNATIKDEKKELYIQTMLSSYGAQPLNPSRACPFCGRPAQFLADRQHIPLLTGTTILVAAPGGVPGLPVCGYCLFAIQFYPLGTIKVAGRPLFWWAPEAEMIFALVGDTFGKVRKLLLVSSDDKMANFSWPRTRLLESAKEVLDRYDPQKPLSDCIGYHVTNYGSDPNFDQYFIPRELLEFWMEVRIAREEVRHAHRHIEQSAWEIPREKKGKSKNKRDYAKGGSPQGESGGDGFADRSSLRNYYYEALGEAFERPDWRDGIRSVVPRFFFQRAKEHLSTNSFELCEMFLRKVGGMEKQRLEIIKEIADRITNDLVLGNNEKRWLSELYNKEMEPQEFLRYLVRVQKRLAELGRSFSLDQVLLMFDIASTEETGLKDLKDARLIRSLFLIRMLEIIGKQKQEMLADILPEADVS